MASFTIQVQFDRASMSVLTSAAQALVSIAAATNLANAANGNLALIASGITSLEPYMAAASKAVDAVASQIGVISGSLDEIAEAIIAPPQPVPVSISLALPTRTVKGVLMANFELPNDEIVTIPILTDDASGAPVAAPSGDVFSVVSSLPASLNAVIGATASGAPAVVVNALVAAHMNADPTAPDLFITVSDSAGLSVFVQAIDIVSDTTAKAITLDLVNTTETSQPTPTNPGP